MAEHDHSTTTSRRALLAGIPITLAAGGIAPALAAVATPSPDAELLGLCADFLNLQAEVDPITTAFLAAPVGDLAELDRLASLQIALAERQDELADRVLLLRARSQDGMAAKAAVAISLLRRVSREEIDYESLSAEDAMAWSLAQDVTARA